MSEEIGRNVFLYTKMQTDNVTEMIQSGNLHVTAILILIIDLDKTYQWRWKRRSNREEGWGFT